VTVDVCSDGCAGIWFDQGELRSFDESAQPAGQALFELAGKPQLSVDLSQRRRCPKCPDTVLMRHFFSAKRAVTVDECATCGGIWLDSGELERIRTEYDSQEARRQAALLGLEEVLVPDRMTLMRKEIEEQLPYDSSRSRVPASLLVLLNVFLTFKTAGAGAAATRIYVSIVPWLCVCFPDVLSTHISAGLAVSKESPRSWLWFFGWLLLFLPEIQLAILWAEGIS